MRMGILPGCVSVCHVYAVPVEARREGVEPGTGATGDWELSCGS